MNEHILLANEKIAQLSAEMQRQDFDAFSDSFPAGAATATLSCSSTRRLSISVQRCSAKAALMRCWYIRRKRRSLPGLRM